MYYTPLIPLPPLAVGRGAPVVGLPQQLTKGELRNATVELTMLDPSRGVCMLFVRGHNFVPSRGPYILDCQRLEGSDYCAMLLCGDERVVMHPGLHPNMGSGGGAREVSGTHDHSQGKEMMGKRRGD